MSETAGPGPGMNVEGRLGGTTRLFLGFIGGALFALVPMYYFYMGREAGLRAAAPPDQPLVTSSEASRAPVEHAPARTGTKPFASRLTYELSRAPEERLAAPPPPARALPASVASTPAPGRVEAPSSLPATSSVIAVPLPAERVANARPISVVPLDPRDRTVEIEKEAQKPEYREARRPQAAKAPPLEPKAAPQEAKAPPPSKATVQPSKTTPVPKAAPEPAKAAAAPAPRVFEGRPVELKPLPPKSAPETASRPMPANDTSGARAEPETDRMAGITPIKPVPKSPERTVVATALAPAAETAPAPADAPARAASGEVASRLEATRGWLAAAPPTTHTIQLMGSNSEEHLKSQLKALSKVVEPGKLHIFRTKAQGKPSITLVYGEFADRQSAQQAMEKLPSSISANKPVLRTVSGIRAEMKQNNTDG